MPKELEQIRAQLQSGKKQDGSALTDAERKELTEDLKQTEAATVDLEKLEVTLPNLTFDRSLSLHAGDREVQVLYFGRGHTAGDVVIFLPKENILITGDLLTGNIPFMRDAYPLEWSETLAGVEKLNFTQVVPGHGPVQQGKERLTLLRAFLDDIVSAVKAQIASGHSNLDEIKRTVKAALQDKYGKQFVNYNNGVESAIARTYAALAPQQ